MGKLVPQDKNDQPARELLKEIQAEKERLVKEGKIRKMDALPPIKDEEKPFVLPEGWEWVRLGDVIDVRDGTHDSPKYVISGIPLVTSKDFENGNINFSNVKRITIEDHSKIKIRSNVERDDILYSMIGGNIGNMVLVDTDKEFSIKNLALFKHFDKRRITPNFLMLYLKVITFQIQRQAVGGAQPFVSLTILRNQKFPLPPLAEQKRIVEKVDELLALCDRLEEEIEKAESKRGEILEGMVTV
jgi:type I restriction enzyme, S subunit